MKQWSEGWRIVKVMKNIMEPDKPICLPIFNHYPNQTAAERAVKHMKMLDLAAYNTDDMVTYEIFLCKKCTVNGHYEWEYRDYKIITDQAVTHFDIIHDQELVCQQSHLDEALAYIDKHYAAERL